jgi:hypothetical protein
MEAVDYGPADKYRVDKLTVFSFGTGVSPQFVKASDTGNPTGPDIMFWLNYVMEEAGHDASSMQIDTIRNLYQKKLGLDFRRFQIGFDSNSIKLLPDQDLSKIHYTEANSLWEMTDKDLSEIEMDDVSKFDLVRIIGQAMDEFIMNTHNQYKSDLINATGRDTLVSAHGDVNIIKTNMGNGAWIDSQPTA